jgi:hypothetical protein
MAPIVQILYSRASPSSLFVSLVTANEQTNELITKSILASILQYTQENEGGHQGQPQVTETSGFLIKVKGLDLA